MAKRIYRSMQGKEVNMELIAQKNELVPAIGNARMNARGDELGPGGKIVRRREDIMADYYERNPGAVKDEQFVKKVTKAVPESASTPTPASAEKKTTSRKESKNEDKTDS